MTAIPPKEIFPCACGASGNLEYRVDGPDLTYLTYVHCSKCNGVGPKVNYTHPKQELTVISLAIDGWNAFNGESMLALRHKIELKVNQRWSYYDVGDDDHDRDNDDLIVFEDERYVKTISLAHFPEPVVWDRDTFYRTHGRVITPSEALGARTAAEVSDPAKLANRDRELERLRAQVLQQLELLR